MIKSQASTTSALNEGQSHIPRGKKKNDLKYHLIDDKCRIVQQLALLLPFSGHSMLKHNARAAYPKDYHSFIQYQQEYSIYLKLNQDHFLRGLLFGCM